MNCKECIAYIKHKNNGYCELGYRQQLYKNNKNADTYCRRTEEFIKERFCK